MRYIVHYFNRCNGRHETVTVRIPENQAQEPEAYVMEIMGADAIMHYSQRA